jgi:hypothetical protein
MTKYVYIGRVKNLNLLRIAVVEFVPHSNRNKLKIKGVDSDVELLYEREVSNDFLSINGIKNYKSPLGNDLYNISLEEALNLISGIGTTDNIEFFKGEDFAKKQILAIQRKKISYVKKLAEEKLLNEDFLEKIKIKGQELDLKWKEILEKYSKIYKTYSGNFSLISRVFGGIVTTKPWILEAIKRDELVDQIISEVPHFINLKCSDRFKSQIELLIEPAISIKDDEKLKLRNKGVNCQEIVNLKITLVRRPFNDDRIGEKVYVKYAEGNCTNCLRDHQISFPEGMTLLYFRDDKKLINDFLKKSIRL